MQGFFMLVSQFQSPNYFLMAYLEDYKMDPTGATPLVTFTIFTDFCGKEDDPRNLALVRADVLSRGLSDDEAGRAVRSVLDNYSDDALYGQVQVFNRTPSDFDVNDYISRMNGRWNQQ
jgi:hypothetical protein